MVTLVLSSDWKVVGMSKHFLMQFECLVGWGWTELVTSLKLVTKPT
jgi:hypothetical protein